MRASARLVLAAVASAAGAVALAQGTDAPAPGTEAVRISVDPLGAGLSVLVADGDGSVARNILVSIGSDGVLLVGGPPPELARKYLSAIAGLGGGDVDFVIDLDSDPDRAAGNPLPGAKGAWVIAQESTRETTRRGGARHPAISYDAGMRLHFNGDRIDLLHPGPAHTGGDTAVIFRDRDIVHLGDVFAASAYPVIDVDEGGSLNGMIAFSEAVLAELEPGALVIPGRGPVSDYRGLADYIAMLKTIRDRMASLIGSGATLAQVSAARPTSEWDGARGDPAQFIAGAYASMSRRPTR
jgi:cyclase